MQDSILRSGPTRRLQFISSLLVNCPCRAASKSGASSDSRQPDTWKISAACARPSASTSPDSPQTTVPSITALHLHPNREELDMSVWTREEIARYIKNDLLLDQLRLADTGVTIANIQDDTPLLGSGLSIDSVDALDLLVGVEKKFGLTLPDLNTT